MHKSVHCSHAKCIDICFCSQAIWMDYAPLCIAIFFIMKRFWEVPFVSLSCHDSYFWKSPLSSSRWLCLISFCLCFIVFCLYLNGRSVSGTLLGITRLCSCNLNYDSNCLAQWRTYYHGTCKQRHGVLPRRPRHDHRSLSLGQSNRRVHFLQKL